MGKYCGLRSGRFSLQYSLALPLGRFPVYDYSPRLPSGRPDYHLAHTLIPGMSLCHRTVSEFSSTVSIHLLASFAARVSCSKGLLFPARKSSPDTCNPSLATQGRLLYTQHVIYFSHLGVGLSPGRGRSLNCLATGAGLRETRVNACMPLQIALIS